MALRHLLVGTVGLAAAFAGGPSTAQRRSVTDLLDRYGAGRFDAVVEELSGDEWRDGAQVQARRGYFSP